MLFILCILVASLGKGGSEACTNSDASPIGDWLAASDPSLQVYAAAFADYGYETTGILKKAELAEIREAFDDMEVKKPHQRLVLMALGLDNRPSFIDDSLASHKEQKPDKQGKGKGGKGKRSKSKKLIRLQIKGRWYDVTKFAKRHPGGRGTLEDLAGQDATTSFRAIHGNSPHVKRMLADFLIDE
jgi:hypothetical protein